MTQEPYDLVPNSKLVAMPLLIATNNSGKIRELDDLFSGLAFELSSLTAFPDVSEIEETGATFAENARLKASGYALQTGLLSLADDSGLEVTALGGRPGVLTARYGGPETSFAEKMEKLLDELAATRDEKREARFVCSMAVADSEGEILFMSDGVCEGRIADKPRGLGGFGYDPIFLLPRLRRTLGQLESAEKDRLSHRARAARKIWPALERTLVANGAGG